MSSSKSITLRRRISFVLAVVPSLALFAVAVSACGDDAVIPLPIFEGGPTTPNENEGGDATNASEAGDASADAPANETSTDSATPDGSAIATNLVISQVQSRGSANGNDEFIEIYNPTAASITFDATWSITDRNASNLATCTTAATTLYTGTGQVIASHKHLLLTTSSYSGTVPGDDTFSAGISDAASIVLVHSAATVDALCFSYDSTTTTTLTTCSTPYICEGTPATNPHDNTGSGTSATDISLERKPGGAGGNGVDANDNATDFATSPSPDVPHDLASAAVP